MENDQNTKVGTLEGCPHLQDNQTNTADSKEVITLYREKYMSSCWKVYLKSMESL